MAQRPTTTTTLHHFGPRRHMPQESFFMVGSGTLRYQLGHAARPAWDPLLVVKGAVEANAHGGPLVQA